MAAVGNQTWKARTTHGRKKIFSSADNLYIACEEYFQWVDDNPLWEHKVAQFQGAPVAMEVPKMRAMTLSGLVIFLDITRDCWTKWKKDKEFQLTVEKVECIIRDQKFAGAAADLFNANIISRDIGLTEKSSQEITGADGGAIKTESKIEWVVEPVRPISNEKNS